MTVSLLYYFRYHLLDAHLTKDVIEIPLRLSRDSRISVTISSSFSVSALASLKSHSLISIKQLSRISPFKSFQLFFYLLANASKIDAFLLYFLDFSSLIWAFYAKLLNPRILIVIKSDLNPRQLSFLGSFDNALLLRTWTNKLKRFLLYQSFSYLLRYVNKIVVETNEGLSSLRSYLPAFAFRRVTYIPNGICLDVLPPLKSMHMPPSEKVICSLGRIGMPFKGHDILANALILLGPQKLKDVSFLLVGPVEMQFQEYLSVLLSSHPWLSDHLTIVGEIKDRKVLFRILANCFVLCHPSRTTQQAVESTALVLPEALSVGCFLLTTSDVPSAKDFITSPEFGLILSVCTPQTLADSLDRLISKFDLVCNHRFDRAFHARRGFSWDRLIKDYQAILIHE